MFDSTTILKAIPSFYRDRFEDKGLLQALYSFVGDYLGDSLSRAYTPLASLSLSSTPLYSTKTWAPIYLSDTQRLSIPADSPNGISLVVYGIRPTDYILNACSRIYPQATLDGDYLQCGQDYRVLDFESKEGRDLAASTGNQSFFSRFRHGILFYSVDPLDYYATSEPLQPLALYPLVFRVNTYLLQGISIDELLATEVVIEHSNETTTTKLMAAFEEPEFTVILLDPSCYSNFIDDSVVKITGLAGESITASVYKNYALQSQEMTLWAYDCEVDYLELFKRWGFLLSARYYEQVPIKSSTQYKNILEEFLEVRLLGANLSRLKSIVSLMGGSDKLAFGSQDDILLTLDLVANRLVSSLTSYSLLENCAINVNIVSNCREVLFTGGRIPLTACALLSCNSASAYTLTADAFSARGPEEIKVTTNSGYLLGYIAVVATSNTLVIRLEEPNYIPNQPLRIHLTSQGYINLALGDYTFSAVIPNQLSSGTLINPIVEVYDLNSGLEEAIIKGGLFIPREVWDSESALSRQVTANLTPFVVGEMPRFSIGDYQFFIPSDDPTGDYFDRTSEDNPRGHAWPTSLKLFQHFLKTKIAVIEPTYRSFMRSTQSTLGALKKVTDITKGLLVSGSLPLADFVTIPEDTLSISVQSPALNDMLIAESYSGIGSIGPTLLLTGAFEATDTTLITELRDEETGVVYPVTNLGADSSKALVQVSSGFTELVNSLGSNRLSLSVEGVFIAVQSLDLATNYIGSDSQLMVIGASYPEYTSYFYSRPSVVSEWLQVAVTTAVPGIDLSEDPMHMYDRLDTPLVLASTTANLEDSILPPSDYLQDPEEI